MKRIKKLQESSCAIFEDPWKSDIVHWSGRSESMFFHSGKYETVMVNSRSAKNVHLDAAMVLRSDSVFHFNVLNTLQLSCAASHTA